jgi:hypothetical protein
MDGAFYGVTKVIEIDQKVVEVGVVWVTRLCHRDKEGKLLLGKNYAPNRRRNCLVMQCLISLQSFGTHTLPRASSFDRCYAHQIFPFPLRRQ